MAPATQSDPPALWARLVVGTFLLATILAVLGAVGIAVHYGLWTQHDIVGEREVTLIIPRGTSWSEVIEILEEEGVVHRPRYFDLWGRRHDLPARVKAGSYRLEGPMRLSELAEALEEGGRVEEVQVTIPEGFSIFAMAELFEEQGLASRERFLEATRSDEALEAAGLSAESFEGYLFPDTYRFRHGTTPEAIVGRLHDRFVEVWDELAAEHSEALAEREKAEMSRHDLVTLASIIERESGAATERPLVARVFYNRLERDMRLQSDPTCVYSADRWDEVPTPDDCKDPLNRYSTYVIDGLPPGPIANPGREALEAAIVPAAGEEAGEYLYFVARRDGTGGHHFSKTLDEHNEAIRKYLK
jgi:UPF0755 protein